MSLTAGQLRRTAHNLRQAPPRNCRSRQQQRRLCRALQLFHRLRRTPSQHHRVLPDPDRRLPRIHSVKLPRISQLQLRHPHRQLSSQHDQAFPFPALAEDMVEVVVVGVEPISRRVSETPVREDVVGAVEAVLGRGG
jgi:hypothetical protein